MRPEVRLDAFAEIHLNAWDVAAGIVLVNEAGGWINDFFAGNGSRDGGPMFVACAGVRDAFVQIADSAKSWTPKPASFPRNAAHEVLGRHTHPDFVSLSQYPATMPTYGGSHVTTG